MTVAAREVLEDCRGALAELTDGVQGRQWRRRWITCVVLLRAIGHVLEKVDGERDAILRKNIDVWWKSVKQGKPEPLIFWDFIDEERNSILKEYQTRAGQGVAIQLSGIELNLRTGEQRSDPPKHAIYHYTINTGPFAGREQHELLAEAISWWESQLNAIDAATSAA